MPLALHIQWNRAVSIALHITCASFQVSRLQTDEPGEVVQVRAAHGAGPKREDRPHRPDDLLLRPERAGQSEFWGNFFTVTCTCFSTIRRT